MPRRDDRLYLGHMADTARRAIRIVSGHDREDYDRDETLRLALTHLVQTIGEAARLVSPAFRQAHPEIPWPAITGMRHRIVHDYLNVDEDLVWEVVTGDLPDLLRQLDPLLPSEPPASPDAGARRSGG